MMHSNFLSKFVVIVSLVFASYSIAGEDSVHSAEVANDTSRIDSAVGKQAFTQCAACHLATGSGVPSVFPPLRSRVRSIAATDEGRYYLISVLLNGLNGAISIEGVNYTGYMQAYGSSFSNSQVAAVLNYISTELTDSTEVAFVSFTEAEVRAARTTLKEQAASSLELRKATGIQ